jgi:hypothetical protein
MEVGQGQNWGCSAKEKKNSSFHLQNSNIETHISLYHIKVVEWNIYLYGVCHARKLQRIVMPKFKISFVLTNFTVESRLSELISKKCDLNNLK